MINQIIAFANQKGGVGKTTSCVNVAAALVEAKFRVLLVDLDPQGNATMGSGVDKADLMASVNEVLQEEIPIQSALIEKTTGGYVLLGANGDLTAAEVHLLRKPKQEQNLKNALSSIQESFDFILIAI